MTTTITSIRICERTVTPLGETADTQWIANLQDDPIAELQKARDYLGREISMREAEAPEYQFQPIDNSGGGGIVHEPFRLEPSPTAHKYTREEFERMEFKIDKAMHEWSRGADIRKCFFFKRSPQGEEYWCRENTHNVYYRRAVLRDLIGQYSEIFHV